MQGRKFKRDMSDFATSLAVLALAALSACQTAGEGVPSSAGSSRQLAQADRLSRDQQFAQAAQQYEDIAAQSAPDLRNRLLLRAARDWLRAENLQRGEALLRQVGDSVPPPDQSLRGLVAARVALLSQRPDQALSELDRIPQPMSREDAPAALELRSKALFAYGRPAGAVMTALDREQLLSDPAEITRNRRMIWDGVQRSAATGANMQAPAGSNRQVAGWLELGRPALTASRNPAAAQPAIDAWRGKYPEHPANDFLSQQVMPQLRVAVTYPAQVALILPLSGRQQAAGIAVRDGLIAALLQQSPDQRPILRVYDSAVGGVSAAYTQAANEGARFVIGPLLKEDVAALMQAQQLTLPTLALNYPTELTSAVPNLYMFALDPEEEARQVAARIAAAGLTRGVALLPKNEKGERIQRAFAAEFAQHGGSLVSTRLYDPASVDFSLPVTTALLIDESRARANALNSILGSKLEFEPRARADVEFIFVSAEPSKGRLLRPALRFHMREAVPVYATSEIFEPDTRANADLDGVMFPDMPWMVAPDETSTQLRAALNQYWPSRARDRARLYAFGYDAFRLVPLVLSQATSMPTNHIGGMTGRLSLDSTGRVYRELDWARIASGSPQLLEMTPIADSARPIDASAPVAAPPPR
jgi:outer membrane PBP1 activator LpoA protein